MTERIDGSNSIARRIKNTCLSEAQRDKLDEGFLWIWFSPSLFKNAIVVAGADAVLSFKKPQELTRFKSPQSGIFGPADDKCDEFVERQSFQVVLSKPHKFLLD